MYVQKKIKLIGISIFLFLSFSACGSEGVLPEPSQVAGVFDINHYANLSFVELGSLGDINGLGDWADKAGAGGRGRNNDFLNWANNSLAAWQINLEENLTQVGRGSAKNWVTVDREDCIADGVPSDYHSGNCGLRGSTIGICYYSFTPSTGEIQESLAIMEKDYLEDSSVSLEDKQAVFIHEVGHCLGLRHPNMPCGGGTGTNLCVMHPVITFGAKNPHADELSAVQAAYNPISDPTGAPQAGRFGDTGGRIQRHFINPVFHISGIIGQGASQEQEESATYEVPIKKAYIMRRDGSEESLTIYPDGRREQSFSEIN